MKVAIAGGKTGGHLFPGIALAERLEKNGHKAVFFCSLASFDHDILEESPYPFSVIASSSPRLGLMIFLIRFLQGYVQSLLALWTHHVDAVVGLGGFPSVPTVLAAWTLRKPIVLMEQNVVMGQANRFLIWFANKIVTSFEETKEHWVGGVCVKAKMECLGTPVRMSFAHGKRASREDMCAQWGFDSKQPIILVLGGSQGAQSLNEMILNSIEKYPNGQWLHVTGFSHYNSIQKYYQKLSSVKVRISKFKDNIDQWMALADYVICRAGGSTIAELKYLQKKALLVPLLSSIDGHQLKNAQACEKEGWAVCVQSLSELTSALSVI